MFEKASRLKLRFNTNRGLVSVEELWDMPLTSADGFNLDALAIEINETLKASSVSFVKPASYDNSVLILKLDLLKHVIATRLKEISDRADAAAKKNRKEYILSIIKAKQEESLKEKSVEELEKELENL